MKYRVQWSIGLENVFPATPENVFHTSFTILNA